MAILLSLMLGTFASEDLACVTAGVLVQRGQVAAVPAIAACALGIFTGDVLLWAAGRLGRRGASRWWLLATVLDNHRTEPFAAWLHRHAAQAILASRFLPGTRLPLYVAAGVVGVSATVFALWALVAAVLWTPVLVMLTARLGEAFVPRIAGAGGLLSDVLAAAGMLMLLYLTRRAGSRLKFNDSAR